MLTTTSSVDLNALDTAALQILSNDQVEVLAREGLKPDTVLFGSFYWGSHELERVPSREAQNARTLYYQIEAVLTERAQKS